MGKRYGREQSKIGRRLAGAEEFMSKLNPCAPNQLQLTKISRPPACSSDTVQEQGANIHYVNSPALIVGRTVFGTHVRLGGHIYTGRWRALGTSNVLQRMWNSS